MANVDALEITDQQKAQVRTLIDNAKRDASDAAVEQAKIEFRAGVAGTRRPEVFDPTKISITAFFECFKPFRRVVGLADSNAIQSFQTYLDPKSLAVVQELDSASEDNWSNFKTEVIKVLSSPREAVQARFELKKATQRADETVAQFGDRLRELGKLGYRTEEIVAMESAMKDALSGGVIRDEISVFLIGSSEEPFTKCLEEAVKLDCAYRARSTLKDEDNIAVSVLKNERMSSTSHSADSSYPSHFAQTSRPPPSDLQNMVHLNPYSADQAFRPGSYSGVNQAWGDQVQRPYNDRESRNRGRSTVICYGCHRPGHYATDCPLQDSRYN